ncbi:MAG: ATP-binding protein [Akkermansiaceae bacterium]|nr:ATP-binding protein [Akkermansiaceae bacterium]MDP4646809.1 ATP-binding protein [Akkermansiaceae bacterium]MDP4719991.1 ATP-binding protein [Akkermansiaceae bacterium]MDP4779725.1 ATP-binding protein [Akkermansiaceae bacterium]MDP4846614.1 ATP-binding protein [Akkermansiaceae bacterium]
MKSGFLEKLVARLDKVEPGEIQQIVTRLIQEKGFLENVFEALQEGLIILDPDGKIMFINRAACSFFGLDASDALGDNIASKIRGIESVTAADTRQAVSRDIEIFYPEHRHLNFYLSPIDDPKNHEIPLGHVMIIRDLTVSHTETQENLESERLNALTLLAAGVAHEIGNPLNSLDIHLQLMERKLRKLSPTDRKSLSGHMHTARQEIQRLDTILKQFLHAVRPTTPRREPHDLNNLLSDTLRLLEPEIVSRGITVDLNLSDKLPAALIDPGQFQQVFYNLLRNAYQAIGGGDGVIGIRTGSTETDFIISISDNGTGIPPEQMGSLFEPYHTTKSSGTGLGLLIVRRIIREHGGEIEIQSRPDEGTLILIRLPHTAPTPRLLPSPTIDT